jgi:hypothetical protein
VAYPSTFNQIDNSDVISPSLYRSLLQNQQQEQGTINHHQDDPPNQTSSAEEVGRMDALQRLVEGNGVESREQPPFSPSSIVAVQNGPGGTRQPEEFHHETGRRYAPSVC